MKRCKTCNLEKEDEGFYKSGRYLHPHCKDCAKEKARKNYSIYYSENKIEIIKRTAEYRKKNYDKLKPWYASYAKERRKTDLNFRLAHNLRKRLSNYVADLKEPKKYRKPKSVIATLGCEVSQLIKYIENQWKDGMSWDNYGSGNNKWEIDHIVPLVNFNLADPNDFSKANHFSNLQPMWSIDNKRKNKFIGIKYSQECAPSL